MHLYNKQYSLTEESAYISNEQHVASLTSLLFNFALTKKHYKNIYTKEMIMRINIRTYFKNQEVQRASFLAKENENMANYWRFLESNEIKNFNDKLTIKCQKTFIKNLSFEKLKIQAIASANAKSFYERVFFNSLKSEPDIISFFINYKKDDQKF